MELWGRKAFDHPIGNHVSIKLIFFLDLLTNHELIQTVRRTLKGGFVEEDRHLVISPWTNKMLYLRSDCSKLKIINQFSKEIVFEIENNHNLINFMLSWCWKSFHLWSVIEGETWAVTSFDVVCFTFVFFDKCYQLIQWISFMIQFTNSFLFAQYNNHIINLIHFSCDLLIDIKTSNTLLIAYVFSIADF